jgi:hypothetical protein
VVAPSARRSLFLTRVVFALLAALAFAFGTTELHDASAADHMAGMAGRGAGMQGVQVAEGASHPLESQHVEGSETRLHLPCMACLLEMQTVATGLAAPATLPVPFGADALIAPTATVERHLFPHLSSPRAPPVLPVG